jgi:hypothetical protein
VSRVIAKGGAAIPRECALREPRIVALTAFAAEPHPARVMRWSEIRPPVQVAQIVVAVEVSDGSVGVDGVAGRTLYQE